MLAKPTGQDSSRRQARVIRYWGRDEGFSLNYLSKIFATTCKPDKDRHQGCGLEDLEEPQFTLGKTLLPLTQKSPLSLSSKSSNIIYSLYRQSAKRVTESFQMPCGKAHIGFQCLTLELWASPALGTYLFDLQQLGFQLKRRKEEPHFHILSQI